ncbi:MAG: MMPL family transporter [Acidobacteriota bacterium]|nr:MMPL family transporter [Acidobacteriota bacterium]
MFNAVSHLVTVRRRAVLAAAIVLLAVAAALGVHASGQLKSGGFVSPTAPSQVASDRIRADFGGPANLLFVVTARTGTVDGAAVAAAGERLTQRLAASPGVEAVSSYWPTHAGGLRSRDGTQAVVAARVAGTDSTVKNRTTALVDALSVGTRAPGPVTVVAGGAAALVWVFQDGHLAGVLGFTPGPTSTTMPLLLFCIAFGLSMDYEVFILSRIKELHDGGLTNDEAVTGGIARSGRMVTTAAGLLMITFVAFGLSSVSFIKLFGLGTALAIGIDATLVRGVLVPAFMRLAGDANWWSPPPLRRLHDRIGWREDDPEPAVGNRPLVHS